MSIRRFTVIVLAGAALLVGTTMLLNWLVDPYARYSTGLIDPLVEQPRRDKYVLLRDLTPPPEIVVLGSSRAMYLRPDLIEVLTGKTAFNAGVSLAMPLDDYVFAHYALDGLSQPPEQLIVCVDLQALHPTVIWNDPSWLAESPLREYADNASQAFSLEDLLIGLISGRQIDDSVQSIQRNLSGDDLERPLYDSHGGIILYDDVGHPARMPFEDYAYWQSFDHIPPERLDELSSLFALADDRDVKLTVVLLPFASDALAAMRQIDNFNRQYAALLDFLDAQQALHGFTLYDWTDPAAFGGDPDGFGDYYHMTQANSDRVVEALFAAGDPPES